MRSVKVERMARNNPRAKTVRKSPRAGRELPGVQPGAARRGAPEGGRISRLFGRFFRRPIVALSSVLVVLTLLAALFVSGVIGRGMRSIDTAIDTMMAKAGFGISEIHLAGNGRTPHQTILAALGLAPGQSIFDADLAAARARLMALDWIGEADVVRRYPDAIFVRLVEKRPFALWQSPPDANGDSRIAVVERAGGVITSKDVEKFVRLPKLIGAGAPQAAADLVDAAQGHRAIAARVAAYERVSGRRWNILFNDGVVIKLPETGWRRELDALERLIIDKGILERDVVEIDLRSPTHYFFMLKNGEKKDVERGKET